MAEKVSLQAEDGSVLDFYVVEETTVAGVDYLLVTDKEEGDADACILKDVSDRESEEAILEIVTDEEEFDAISRIFESLMDDVDFVKEDKKTRGES